MLRVLWLPSNAHSAMAITEYDSLFLHLFHILKNPFQNTFAQFQEMYFFFHKIKKMVLMNKMWRENGRQS